MQEIWKDIPNYEGYQVSNLGRVRTYNKTTYTKNYLDKISKKRKTPNDWCYIYNFDNPNEPVAVNLVAGDGNKFKDLMENFIRDIRRELKSTFKTDNVENLCSMFMFCKKLKDIDLKSFNTSKVRSMRSMFKYCVSLSRINLLSFQTENVKNMNFMFQECGNNDLKEIDLSSFNFKYIDKDEMILMFFSYIPRCIIVSKNSDFKPNYYMFFSITPQIEKK